MDMSAKEWVALIMFIGIIVIIFVLLFIEIIQIDPGDIMP